MIRVGLIGLGRHGARYARHLCDGDVPGLTLVAVSRRETQRGATQAADWGCRFYSDWRRLVVAADVDLVIAVVPAVLNAEIAAAVAAAGKPALLEKPLARTAREGEAICRAFESAGCDLACAQTLRFDPMVSALQAQVLELGTVRGFEFEQRIEQRGLDWEDDPLASGGGVLIQTAIHSVDALRVITGFPGVRLVNAATGRMLYRRNEDHGSMSLAIRGERTAGREALGTVAASKLGESRHMRFALFCADGGVEGDFIQRQIRVRRGSATEVIEVPASPTVVTLLTGIRDALVDSAPMPVTGRDALESLKIIDSAYGMAEMVDGSR